MQGLRRQWLVVLLALCAGAPAVAEEPQIDESISQYFRGLRERQLFRLAESYCLQRLARTNLSPAWRAELTLELSRTLTEHASYAAPAEQAILWNQARQRIEDFLKADPQHPRRILLEVQLAIVHAAAGEWGRWQAETQPGDETIARRAAGELKTALAALRTLDTKISEQIRKGPPVRRVEGELLLHEWRSLSLRVRQKIGLALLDLVHVLQDDSPEQAGALAEAQKTLKPLADAPEDDDFTWASRLALIECTRLVGDDARALRDIQTLEKRTPPRNVADRLLAERIRVLQSQKKLADVPPLLDQRERETDPVSGELAFLRIQSLLDQARTGAKTPGAAVTESLLRTLQDRAETLQREQGGYWAWRAQRLLELLRDEKQYGSELAAAARKAQAEFDSGRLSEAAESFGKAAALARGQERPDLAFQFGFTRASVEVQEKKWPEAAGDLLDLVMQFPDDPKAADAHLLAAYCLGRSYDEKQTKPRREEFERVLAEHRDKYRAAGTFGEATWMLATLQERRLQYTAALDLYREIPWEHARAHAALLGLARCFEAILDRLRDLKRPTDEWDRNAITTMQKALPSVADAKLRLDRDQTEAAVRFARILLRLTPPDYAAADRWLLRALAAIESRAAEANEAGSVGAATREPKTQALQLRIISLAGQREFQEARRKLDELSSGSPAELLAILEGLAPLTTGDRPDPFRDLGELQLQAALRLNEKRDALEPAVRRRLDECLARAYAAAGQSRRSIEVYEALLKDAPRDKRLLTELGELLLSAGDKGHAKQAVATFRKLEALWPSGSDEWLAARYDICRSLFAQGETAEACKLLTTTRKLFPGLGGEALIAKFDELEKKCGKK